MMDFLKTLYNNDLNGDGDVDIGRLTFTRSRILSELEPDTYDLAFNEWLDERKQNCLEKANEILSLYDNAPRFGQLKRCYQTGLLMPFVGAGMSIPSGYPGWTSFLYQLCDESHVSNERLNKLLAAGKYEDAAQLIHDDLGPALFNEQLESVFLASYDLAGSLQYLPILFPNASVVTTNFDKLIEEVYTRQNQGFNGVKSGRALNEVLRTVASGSRVLLKLHGECDQVYERVLTGSEYEEAYVNEDTVKKFFSRFLFKGSLLCLGCSLSQDRTIKSMAEIVDENGSETLPRHYAFLEYRNDIDRVARKKELAKANIFPIWYPEDEHDESMEALFLKLLDE